MDFTLVKKEPTDARREIFNIIQRARELPGVKAVGVGTMLPYGNFTNTRRIMSTRSTLSNDPKAPDPGASALYTATTPGYFESIGVKILRGRDFTQAECENRDGRPVGIIDQEMAKKLFPNEDAIGQHVRYTIPPRDGSPNDMEIVGIVNTHRHDVNNETPLVRLFVPFAQGYTGNVFLHLRLATQDRQSVAGMISTTRSMLRGIDPDLPIIQMSPYVDLLDRCVGLWIVRLGATLFGAFGLIALLLAVVGVYGVKAYAVACRTREIGIRMALGAHRKDVFALIMRQGALQTALAVFVGLLLSLAAGRVLAQILYQVSPSDPFALITSSVMLTIAALLACFLPARRATHVNPITALRTE
jgi:predicted permease